MIRKSCKLSPEVSQRLALRVSTFCRVLKSITTIAWIGLGLVVTLYTLGVDLGTVIAGAGIAGVAISFAFQNLIKDIVNGFLILMEDQYAVGDVIIVDKVSGLVENMNLRITQLRDNEGRLTVIPNSAIATAQNLSKDWSRVDLTITVAYDTNPDRALEAIAQLAQEMYRDRDWHSKMPEPPEVLGIDEINHQGILIRVWIKTQPLQQWIVAREFRRRLKLALEYEGISIGVPQQSIWYQSSISIDEPEIDGNDGHKDIASKMHQQ